MRRSAPGDTVAIAGFDPGSKRTGYALVRFDRGGRVVELELGTWTPGTGGRSSGLARLHAEARAWLGERAPSVIAVESLFHHRNSRSALVLAEARGALLAAIGEAGVELAEYPPATIKKTICGTGGADKAAVRRALERSVPGITPVMLEGAAADATDALAAAVCHQAHARVARIVRGVRT